MTKANAGFDANRLLEEQDFLFALAYGLAKDRTQADDLVQETLLAALEQRPRMGSAFKGWLATVTRRGYLRQVRTGARRSARERAISEQVVLPSAQDMAAQRELQGCLRRAIEQLTETHKSTLVLRYGERLMPRQIAERQEIPLATVKTRLQRALNALRGDLEAALMTDMLPGVWIEELTVYGAFSMVELKEPKAWHMAGSHPEDYEGGVDRTISHSGEACGFIRGRKDEPEGFGTLMQCVRALKFLETRVRMTAWCKSEGLDGWAGLWLRVDGPNPKRYLGFDNMQDRPIKGTTQWTRYEIVLDVPRDAEMIAFGVLQRGRGQTWVDEFAFESVGKDVPTTGNAGTPDSPQNLSFDE